MRTERLVLRRWRDTDREPFAAMNADPEVMEHYVAPLTPEETNRAVDRIEARFDEHGWGLWAVELVGTGSFIGYTGLDPAPTSVPFAPAGEVGWRLAKDHWGHGYATEAAAAMIAYAFDQLRLRRIVATTENDNTRSINVMRRLGMRLERNPRDQPEWFQTVGILDRLV
jgi:RimJ/RimL family protein N-acetyltransferase